MLVSTDKPSVIHELFVNYRDQLCFRNIVHDMNVLENKSSALLTFGLVLFALESGMMSNLCGLTICRI